MSEVVRASLRLLEEHEQRGEALRLALLEGEKSGEAMPLDIEEVKRAASSKFDRFAIEAPVASEDPRLAAATAARNSSSSRRGR